MRYSSILLAALIAYTVAAQDITTSMTTKTKAVKNNTDSNGAGAGATETSTMAAMDSNAPSTTVAGGTKGSATSKASQSKLTKTSGRNSTATDMSMSGSMHTETGVASGMSAMGSATGTAQAASATGSGTTSSKPAVQTKNASERLLATSGGAMVIAGLGVVFAVYM
jgi:hypothetical protein